MEDAAHDAGPGLMDSPRGGRGTPPAESATFALTEASMASSAPQHFGMGGVAPEDVVVVKEPPQPLPRNVHLSVLTETVLREAPFAQGRARGWWRAQLSGPDWAKLVTDSFWWALHHLIQNNDPAAAAGHGAVATAREDDPVFDRMAASYVHLFERVATERKDLFFTHFYEAHAYSIILALCGAFPRHKDRLDSTETRQQLLEACARWSTGMSPPLGRRGRSWLTREHAATGHGTFAHLVGNATPRHRGAAATSPYGLGSTAGSSRHGAAPDEPDYGADGSSYLRVPTVLMHSPFVHSFLKQMRISDLKAFGLRIGLTVDMSDALAAHKTKLATRAVVTNSTDAAAAAAAAAAALADTGGSSGALRKSGSGRPWSSASASRSRKPPGPSAWQLQRLSQGRTWTPGRLVSELAELEHRRKRLVRKHATDKREASAAIHEIGRARKAHLAHVEGQLQRVLASGEVSEFANYLVSEADAARRKQRGEA